MFKCETCGTSSRPSEKLTKTVTKTRPHRHPERHYRAKGKEMVDLGNQFATQIEREQILCRLCATVSAERLVLMQSTPPLTGADAEALLASIEHSASPEEMTRRRALATEALAYVMTPKSQRPES